MRDEQQQHEEQPARAPETAPQDGGQSIPEARPWEEIEPGRYQPKRIRGSCLGRELG
jgi:hypothetical protein